MYLHGSDCLDPNHPLAHQWIQVRYGKLTNWVGVPVATDNIMSYYFNLEPQITVQQAVIVRATATIRNL